MEQGQTQGSLNLVEEFRKQYIKEELPKFLYHYTSIEGFKGIIHHKEIWATAAGYLRGDPTEITTAKKVAGEILKEREQDFGGKEELYRNCKTVVETSSGLKEYQFVCSFTEEGDLSSQWRAYCPKGGVSIGFTVPKITENDEYLRNSQNYYVHERYIYKCLYEPPEQRQKMNELFDFLLSRTEAIGILDAFFWNMIRTFSYSFKRESFRREKEWRLCCFVLPDEKQIRHRVKDSRRIPYLPFAIVDRENDSIISRIKIGRSREKEKLRRSVSSYLEQSKVALSPENIEFAQTPYQIQ